MIILLPAKHPIAGWLPALIPLSRKIQLLRVTAEVIIRICSHAQLCSFMHPLRRHAVFQGFFLQLLKQLVFRFIWHKHLHAVILDDAIVFLSPCIILHLDSLAQLLLPFQLPKELLIVALNVARIHQVNRFLNMQCTNQRCRFVIPIIWIQIVFIRKEHKHLPAFGMAAVSIASSRRLND